MSDEFNINISSVKKGIDFTKKNLKDKRVIWGITILLLLAIVIFSSDLRVQNLHLLQDSTTGEYIPLALDPFYFLRIAETISEQGGLPEFDNLRQPYEVEFSKEVLPRAIVTLHKIFSVFNSNLSIQYVDVISPVIFFGLGLLVFFFFIYTLTNSKFVSLASTALLSVMPSYLYRTMAGFADHESIGMFAFFSALLIYSFCLKYLEKKGIEEKPYWKVVLGGLILGLFSAFTVASWGGVATFLLLIIPSSFILFWLINTQDLDRVENKLISFLIFYVAWFVSTILFILPYGFSLQATIARVFLNVNGMLNGIVLFFIISDFIIIKYKDKLKQIYKLRKIDFDKYRILASGLLAIVISSIFFLLFGSSVNSFVSHIINKLFLPFGAGRVTLTVAENAQPFLRDWIAQIGKNLFWIFYLGTILFGFEISKGINHKKSKILFFIFWVVMISSVLFSRFAPNSILNGSNLLSKLVYFGGMVFFLGYLILIYFKNKIKIKSEYILIFSILFLMIVALRSAIRLFFLITPIAAFIIMFSIFKMYQYIKHTKDDLLKLGLMIFVGAIAILLIMSFFSLANTIKIQAANTGPSAGVQWQQAMSWVRDNTNEGEIFLHWWDYGYWVQYLGERPTLADGGHFQGDFRSHMIGRYVLTSTDPKTTKSFMKSNGASYLLIDPTDLGKYPAYSRIGSDDTGEDRFSQIPIMVLDASQTQTSETTETRIYQGGTILDEDIIYNLDGKEIFLPKNNAFIGAIILEITKGGGSLSFQQPNGIFVYNGEQIRIPIRYIHLEDQLIDTGIGIEAVIKLIPRVTQTEGIQIDNIGAAIYLSPKVKSGLFAQLYLMNDPFNNYEDISLAHSASDPIISSLNVQGASLGEFAEFGGFRGPIKIWDLRNLDNPIIKEEFTRISGEFAEFDYLVN